jgi:hypothetical protein
VVNVTALTCWFTECVATATPSRPTWPSCSPALAVTRFTEGRIGRSVKKFARIARRYRAVQIRADRHALTAEDPPPPGLRNALAHIKQQERGTH